LVDLKYVHNNQTVKFSIKEYINHNIQILKKKGVKEIICNCAGCYKTISEDWPKFVDESFPFKVTHITEFLAEKLERNRIMLKSFPKTITYHDPCHLGRHMGIYEEPRIILNSIPDANIIEMKNNKENGLCCGAGGGFKAHFPDEALKIAKLRVREALDDGAEIISTACVFCKNNLNLAIKDIDKEIRVLNIEDILANLIK
jgi:heterodisulfide reductase subunit D